ncbi:CobW family GTP-binding protein [Rhodovibrionaceae bacterium A322]
MSLIPVTLLTGFLGSGKTTLLKALLKRPEMANTAVIVNEFGEVGLDHLLVEKSEENMVQLNSGCLCCTVRGDLANTLGQLDWQMSQGEIPAFDRVVIETTGLADPAPIIHTLTMEPRLSTRFRLDGVLVTVDAVNGAATLDAQMESVKQAAVADRLLLTKTDMEEGAAAADALESRLKQLNPTAIIQRPVQGEMDPKDLFGLGLYDPETKSLDVQRWLRDEALQDEKGHHHDHGHDHHHDHDHGHDHDHDHAHDVNRHDDHIKAYCITRDHPISGTAFSLFLELLMANRGPDLLRVKGIIDIEEKPGEPAVIHGVQHVFHPVVWLPEWPEGKAQTRLVFITRDVPQAWIEKLLDGLTGPQKATAEAVAEDRELFLDRNNG